MCVHGFQVIASDVNQDGLLEILAIDNSGNIACKSLKGKMVSVESFVVIVLVICCNKIYLQRVFGFLQIV